MKKLIILLLLAISPLFAKKGVYFNLDFENYMSTGNYPEKWIVVENQGLAGIDTEVSLTGKSSLKFVNETNVKSGAWLELPVDKFNNSRLKIEAFIKANRIEGKAYFVLEAKSNTAEGRIYSDTVKTTGDWTKCMIDAYIDISVNNLRLNCIFEGIGTVWFDSFIIIDDGQPYIESLPYLMDQQLIDTFSNTLINIPAEDNIDKFSFIDNQINDSKIIGLGLSENSDNVLNTAYSLASYLTSNKEFSSIAMDMTNDEADALNNMIKSKDNIVANDPFSSFLKVLQEENLNGKDIRFYGYKLPSAEKSIRKLREFFVNYDSLGLYHLEEYNKTIKALKTAKFNNNKPLADSISLVAIAHARMLERIFETNQALFIRHKSEQEYAISFRAARNLLEATRIMVEYSDDKTNQISDSLMAQNLLSIVNNHPKVIIIAPNYLLSKDYIFYQVIRDKQSYILNITTNNINQNDADKGYYLENHLKQVDKPFYFIDLHKDAIAEWAARYFIMKSFRENKVFWLDGQLDKMFDGIIYYSLN